MSSGETQSLLHQPTVGNMSTSGGKPSLRVNASNTTLSSVNSTTDSVSASTTSLFLPSVIQEAELDAGLEEGTPVDHVPGNSGKMVFSIASTMIGSTLLVIPQYFHRVGTLMALLLTLYVGCVNGYSCVVLGNLGPQCRNSFNVLLQKIAPKILQNLIICAGVFILLGSTMLYHIYVADGVLRMAGIPNTDPKWRPVVAIIIAILVFLVSLLRSLKPLFIAASYAFITPVFCLIFIIVKSGIQLKTGSTSSAPHNLTLQDVPWALGNQSGVSPPSLICQPKTHSGYGHMIFSGSLPHALQLLCTLHLSYYIANVIHSLLTQATRPRNNSRDIILAYITVLLTYAIPASMAAYAFRDCHIPGDFLLMFPREDIYGMVTQVMVILLVLVVYPVLFFISREALLKIYYGEDGEWPYWAHILCNSILLVLTTLPCATGMTTAFVSAGTGIVAAVVSVLVPISANLILQRRKVQSGEEMKSLSVWFYARHIFLLIYGSFIVITSIVSLAAPAAFNAL